MRLPAALTFLRQKIAVSVDHTATIADLAYFAVDLIDSGQVDGFEFANAVCDEFEKLNCLAVETARQFNLAVKAVRKMRLDAGRLPPAAAPVDRGETDAGFLTRFFEKFPDSFYFVEGFGWFAWSGEVWKSENGCATFWEAVIAASLEFSAAEIAQATDPERVKQLHRFFSRYRSAGGCRSVADLAAHDGRFRRPAGIFDQLPELLNCQNGTLDLSTGAIRPFERRDFLTCQLDIAYDPAAGAPRWRRFLETIIPDRTTREYLRRAIGYSATGAVSEQAMFILYGSGANGKSTFIEAIEHVLSDYHVKAGLKTFSVNQSDSTADLARMFNARFVTVSENDDGGRLSEGLIKTATGDNQITARRLYENPFTYSPRFKVWLAVNHRPIIRGTDDGIWRRLKLIPFETTIADNQRDRRLGEKLRAEAAGILAWIADGAAAWFAGGLNAAPAIQISTAGYRAEMDIFGRWIEENCDVEASFECGTMELFRNFSEWAREAGEFTMTLTSFGRRLGDRGFLTHRDPAGRKFRNGLQLSLAGRGFSSRHRSVAGNY